MFQCKVCQESFSSGWDHVLSNRLRFPFYDVIDDKHQEALDNAAKANYDCPCPFCGSHINFVGHKENYEVVCDGCGYFFDED